MMRKYEAWGDNGRDRVFFTFWSKHNANSKANLEDARLEFKRRHGHNVKIYNTSRIPDDSSY